MSEYYANNHDHLIRTSERLNLDLALLRETRHYAHGDRRKQIDREMAYSAFELAERAREQYNVEIEEAWGQYSST